MKFVDLVRILHESGFYHIRNSKHKIFSNGIRNIAVPQGKDVNKILTKHIIKQATNKDFKGN